MTTVMLHPVGLDKDCWQFLDLPDAIAISFPGHGDEPGTGPVTMEGLADFVSERCPEPVHVVGLSLGAMVALHTALRHPHLVKSLLVACGASATHREALLQRAEDAERLGMPGVLNTTMTRWFTAGALETSPPGVTYARHRLLADDPATFASYWRAMSLHDVTADLGEIAVPTTVVAGSYDVSVTPRAMRVIADAVPGAKYMEVPGPHMLQLECPERLRDVMVSHIEWAESR